MASSFREAERRVIIDALSDASGRIAGKGGAAVDQPLRIPSFRYKIGTTEREKKRYAAP
jgi:hypothetical protein